MALFESYERRIDKINGVLAQYGIESVEACREMCQAKGFDPYEIVKGIQPICFENACWAYTVGAAIAMKKGVKTAAEAATAIGSEYLRTLAWFFLIFCVMYITNGVLQGSGDVAYPTAGSMTSLIVRVIVANIMATFPAIGYRSIFYSIPIGWVCGTSIVFIRYLTGKWKTKGVVRTGAQNAKEEAAHG